MTVLVTSLASGSSGNALLIQTSSAALLIDCGLSLRAIEKHLRYRGLQPTDVHAILLTHEHSDHTLSVGSLARRYNLPVVCNGGTSAALAEQLTHTTVELLPIGQTVAIGPFTITSFSVPHDAAAPVGYHIAVEDIMVGLAIDLGSWTEAIVDSLRQTDLLIVEANHDREQLQAAPYPWSLRQRICGPLGHLDNIQAGELLARIGADGRRRDVWLAHLSEQANSPQKALDGVIRVLNLAEVVQLQLIALPRKTDICRGNVAVWSSDKLLQQRELFG